MKTEHFALLTKVSKVLDWIVKLYVFFHIGSGMVLDYYSKRASKVFLYDEANELFSLSLILGGTQMIAAIMLLIFAMKLWYCVLLFVFLAIGILDAIIKIELESCSNEIDSAKDEDSNY